MRNRTGEVWQDGQVIFLVIGPPATYTPESNICYHPVLILDGDRSLPPGTREQISEVWGNSYRNWDGDAAMVRLGDNLR